MTNQPTPEKLEEWGRVHRLDAPGYVILLKWTAFVGTMAILAVLLVKLTWTVMW